MPKAILAIRRYPVALGLATVLFLASLILATSSIGKILGDGDDEGSGMGGTGRHIDFGGSGSPFLGDQDAIVPEEQPMSPSRDWQHRLMRPEIEPEPALPQAVEELAELLESPPRPPEPESDTMIGLDLPTRNARTERGRDMASADAERDRVDTVLRIELPTQLVPDTDGRSIADRISPFQLEEEAGRELASGVDAENAESPTDAVASEEEEQRVNRERIQRPELPPFQRTRPVQRASITPPRPSPLSL